MATRTLYELLGLAPEADAAAVKGAYRKLSRTLHPDMAGGSSALFGLITEAYEVLHDPTKKAAYDDGEVQTRPAPEPGPGPAQRAANEAQARAAAQALARDEAAARVAAIRTAALQERARADGLLDDARRASSRFRPWEPVVIAVVLTGAFFLRFTGLTAELFGVKPGDHVLLAGVWPDALTLSMLSGSWLQVAIGLVALPILGVYGCTRRRRLGPLPLAERLCVLAVATAVVGAVEMWMGGWAAGGVSLLLVGGYGLWFALLAKLPRPANVEQWTTLRAWLRAVLPAGPRSRFKAKAAPVRTGGGAQCHEPERPSGTRYQPAVDGPVDPRDRRKFRGRYHHARFWGRLLAENHVAPWPTRLWAVLLLVAFTVARTRWEFDWDYRLGLPVLVALVVGVGVGLFLGEVDTAWTRLGATTLVPAGTVLAGHWAWNLGADGAWMGLALLAVPLVLVGGNRLTQWRRTVGPLPHAEEALFITVGATASVVAAGVGPWAGVLVAPAVVLGVWGCWSLFLVAVPAPVTAAQWVSMRTWAEAVRRHPEDGRAARLFAGSSLWTLVDPLYAATHVTSGRRAKTLRGRWGRSPFRRGEGL